MTRILAALAAIFLLAGPAGALAQTAGEPAPPSARQLQLAQQLIDESGMAKNYDQIVKNMFDPIFAEANKMFPNSPPANDAARKQSEAMTAVMIKIKPRLLAVSVEAYARTFSEAELEGILAFYQTPAGRSMLTKMPQMTRNITDATVKLMPEMMEVMMAEVCARSAAGCPPAARTPSPKAPRT